MKAQIDAAVKAERERCAQVAERLQARCNAWNVSVLSAPENDGMGTRFLQSVDDQQIAVAIRKEE
jgi:hypothetical protein